MTSWDADDVVGDLEADGLQAICLAMPATVQHNASPALIFVSGDDGISYWTVKVEAVFAVGGSAVLSFHDVVGWMAKSAL